MTDYKKYINALRKCAKEHEGDRTFTGQIIVSNLCRETANLLEALEQEPTTKNCESCRYYGSHHEVCNYCYKCSLWTEQEPTDKCKWIKYDHRTMCPKEHIDVDSPYWRIPENRMETLKYCPYCGKEIEVEE